MINFRSPKSFLKNLANNLGHEPSTQEVLDILEHPESWMWAPWDFPELFTGIKNKWMSDANSRKLEDQLPLYMRQVLELVNDDDSKEFFDKDKIKEIKKDWIEFVDKYSDDPVKKEMIRAFFNKVPMSLEDLEDFDPDDIEIVDEQSEESISIAFRASIWTTKYTARYKDKYFEFYISQDATGI
jgi:hypothetical protein